ncbi:MAG: TetR/AcrR family transcriptional regulator [Actinomycetota bacterium]
MTEPGTATALIDAAEARFAAEGIDGTSLRAVMRDAGTDPGAVHYHFGGRAKLAAAVLDRVLVPLNDRRLELLDRCAERGAPTVEELTDALVRPDVEAAGALERRGAGRGRLIGRIYLDPAEFVTSQVEERFRPVAQRFFPHLLAAVPDVGPDLVAWRIRWCLFGTLGALWADPDEPLRHDPEELVGRLVTTIAAALAAPTRPEEAT